MIYRVFPLHLAFQSAAIRPVGALPFVILEFHANGTYSFDVTLSPPLPTPVPAADVRPNFIGTVARPE